MESLCLIVGLGNPGAEYVRTRHNAGFLVVERLAQRWRARWREPGRFPARTAPGGAGGRRCILCEPQTYMNLSGEAVAAVAGFYKVSAERLLVVVDDADLALGQLRLRAKGSSAGHHGLESIERHLGTREFARLRLGIGRRATEGRQITNHVLGRFGPEEAAGLEKILERAADAAECWVATGVSIAMNRFNGAVTALETKDD